MPDNYRALNLGSGYRKREGEVNLDMALTTKPDVCGDAQYLPFKDNCFDAITANHVFEHIDNIVKAVNECWRVLKDGGIIQVVVPIFPEKRSIADPTHRRFFILDSFLYFEDSMKLTGLRYGFKRVELGPITDGDFTDIRWIGRKDA